MRLKNWNYYWAGTLFYFASSGNFTSIYNVPVSYPTKVYFNGMYSSYIITRSMTEACLASQNE